MIFRITERYYRESKKLWLKRRFSQLFTDYVTFTVKRTTVWFLFIPICYWEKITSTNL